MRKYIFPAVIAIFTFGVGIYMLRVLSPFQEEPLRELIKAQNVQAQAELLELLNQLAQRGLIWEYLNLRNVLIVSALFAIGIWGTFSLLHLIIDKLFFKYFYQPPSLVLALRRGGVFTLLVFGLLVLRLLFVEWYVYLVWVVVVIGIEVLITNVTMRMNAQTGEARTLTYAWQAFRLQISDVRARISSVYQEQREILEAQKRSDDRVKHISLHDSDPDPRGEIEDEDEEEPVRSA